MTQESAVPVQRGNETANRILQREEGEKHTEARTSATCANREKKKDSQRNLTGTRP